MTSNVIKFPGSDDTPDDVFERWAGKFDRVIVIGLTKDGASLEYDDAGFDDFGQVLGQIEMQKPFGSWNLWGSRNDPLHHPPVGDVLPVEGRWRITGQRWTRPNGTPCASVAKARPRPSWNLPRSK